MKKFIKTLTGSTYVIDIDTMTWERSSDHEILGAPGLNGERLRQMPEVNIGERMLLIAPSGIWVSTSPVQEVWDEA